MPAFAIILPAAGKSTRFGGSVRKPFVTLAGRPIWQRTLELFHRLPEVRQIVLVLAADEIDDFRQTYAGLLLLAYDKVTLAPGGAERFESVANGLAALHAEIEYVAVHDVVRAMTTEEVVRAVFAAAVTHGGAIAAIPCADTLKRAAPSTNRILDTVPRLGMYQAQTPQVFERSILERAYAARARLGTTITDDAQLVEAAGGAVVVVAGSPLNFKITTPDDLKLAQALLNPAPPAAEKPRSVRDDDV